MEGWVRGSAWYTVKGNKKIADIEYIAHRKDAFLTDCC